MLPSEKSFPRNTSGHVTIKLSKKGYGLQKLEENLNMPRVRAVSQFYLHAVNMHGSCTGSSQFNVYSLNISKFKWSHFKAAPCINEPKNYKTKPLTLHRMVDHTAAAVLPVSFQESVQCCNIVSINFFSRSLNSHCLMKKELYLQQCVLPSVLQLSCRSYSSNARSKTEGLQNVTSADCSTETMGKTANSSGNEWSDIWNDAHQSAMGAVSSVGRKVQDVFDQVIPFMQQLYVSHPYLEQVIIPVGGTVIATLLAWFVMPRILKKLHKYASRNPLALFSGSPIQEEISYEKSLWGALEDPARYLITFMAFYELGIIIAPTTSRYLPQAWRGAVALSFVWFLHRWKTNVFTRAMEKPASIGLDRDKLLTLEKISSMGFLVLGSIALAEACGVAVQSILTVGGIGGVATAFAARDILGNILNGLSLQFTKPFSLGDNIKAGSIEGQVVEMGLTTTSLMNPEKFPVVVPNSLFASQVIVNKSRARYRACVKTIPIQIDDLQKVPHVTVEIKSMLCSNPSVFLEKDSPYCFLSRIENSFKELTLGYNLKTMTKDESYATEQDILLQAATIITKHSAKIG